MLVVYVDDFKMAGPKENMAIAWKMLQSTIKMDAPKPINKYLGCEHREKVYEIEGKTVREQVYDMRPYMRKCVEKYLEVAPDTDLKHADTPFIEDPIAEEEEMASGKLDTDAAKILMSLLYGARYARWDLLRAINQLATRLTRWTEWCDRALYKLVCYLHTTVEHLSLIHI